MNFFKPFRKKEKKESLYKEKQPKELENVLRRRPKDIIEERKDNEYFYAKFPGENLREISIKGSEEKDSVKLDIEKVEEMLKKKKTDKYSVLHTHSNNGPGATFPSYNDIHSFLRHDKVKTMWIAQQNSETGKVEGYFCLRKTKNTPLLKSQDKLNSNALRDIYKSTDIYELNINRGEFLQGLNYLAKKHDLKYRVIPAQGYSFDRRRHQSKFVKKGNLEDKIEISIIITFFIGSLFLLSSNITGNSIANLSQPILNWGGIILFLLGIFLTYYYLAKNR